MGSFFCLEGCQVLKVCTWNPRHVLERGTTSVDEVNVWQAAILSPEVEAPAVLCSSQCLCCSSTSHTTLAMLNTRKKQTHTHKPEHCTLHLAAGMFYLFFHTPLAMPSFFSSPAGLAPNQKQNVRRLLWYFCMQLFPSNRRCSAARQKASWRKVQCLQKHSAINEPGGFNKTTSRS